MRLRLMLLRLTWLAGGWSDRSIGSVVGGFGGDTQRPQRRMTRDDDDGRSSLSLSLSLYLVRANPKTVLQQKRESEKRRYNRVETKSRRERESGGRGRGSFRRAASSFEQPGPPLRGEGRGKGKGGEGGRDSPRVGSFPPSPPPPPPRPPPGDPTPFLTPPTLGRKTPREEGGETKFGGVSLRPDDVPPGDAAGNPFPVFSISSSLPV